MQYKMIEIPVNSLIDILLEAGIVPNAKFHYRWNEFSEWQIKSLIEIGLKPEHKLLDVGCGPLRFGIQAINYLNDGNYYGIDAWDKYIELGPKIVQAAAVGKKYHVIYNRNFEFDKLGSGFDFAMAQSVFTHLSKDQIIDCMYKMKKVMAPGGKFLFSNINTNVSRGFLYSGYLPMIAGTGCTDEFYSGIAKDLNIKFLPDQLPHPTQKAHIFEF